MSDTNPEVGRAAGLDREAVMSALFAQLVLQQANTAMMLLGKVPHPESGQVMKDLDAASLFIDELEMLEVKTKGNLSKEETNLLKQSLMSLRLAFVQAADQPVAKTESKSEPRPAAEPAPAAGTSGATPTSAVPSEEEQRKKFSKKY
jgi:hypothetical protein